MAMKKRIILCAVVFVLTFVTVIAPAFADDSKLSGNADLHQDVTDSKNNIADLEKNIGQNANQHERLLQPKLSGLEFTGGISAGFFYASNPGKEASDYGFLLSNFLVEVSSKDDLPVGFVGALGETSTPSLLDPPENNYNLDLEYASLTLNLNMDISLEAGLLQPNAGFENTYTFNNVNVILGVLASQQPYNAYGARLGHEVNDLHLYVGFYKERLDNEEYEVNGSAPNNTWEIGVGGSILDYKFSIYHYHLVGLRNLTGVVVERTIRNIYLAFNIDYWSWDSQMDGFYGRKSSIGGAVYVCPRFGPFSLPVRLEFIDQGKSRIYSESLATEHIYTATISPTYSFYENAYVRVESAYVNADAAFADKSGTCKNYRISLAAEVGYLF